MSSRRGGHPYFCQHCFPYGQEDSAGGAPRTRAGHRDPYLWTREFWDATHCQIDEWDERIRAFNERVRSGI